MNNKSNRTNRSQNPKSIQNHSKSTGKNSSKNSVKTSNKNSGKGGSKNNHRNHQKKEEKGRGILSTIMMFIAAGVFLFSVYQIVMMVRPYYTGGQEYDKVKEMAVTQPEDTDESGSEEEAAGDGFRVDFDALLAQNPDTVAWIRMEEPAVISYPVVKGRDNEEYLTKTFSANDNKLGAIFWM